MAELAVYEGLRANRWGERVRPGAGAHRLAGGAGGHLQRTWKCLLQWQLCLPGRHGNKTERNTNPVKILHPQEIIVQE